jgi:drug/metabolite transporter (DMT)-like permease
MTNALLYAATVAIWGTSWIAIKLQLGVVAPEVSVAYRFALAAALLLLFCLATGRRLRFSRRAHGRMALQGLLLFCTNFYLVYLGSQYLPSGLVSVAFSTLSLMSIGFGTLLFGAPLRPRVLAGAAVGLAGIVLVFWPEVTAFDLSRQGTVGLLLSLAGTASAALGMLLSGRNQLEGLPLVQTNAFGMAYGAAFMAGLAVATGRPFAFDPAPAYALSLVWLAVFASVVAFSCYLSLVGRIGADRAAYASVLFPLVALTISTVWEDFRWTAPAVAGVVLVLAGNVLVLGRRAAGQPAPASPGFVRQPTGGQS